MGKCVVVTEGQDDVLLLRAILKMAPNNSHIMFEAAGGWSAADSYARSALVQNEADVALVVDADSCDPNLVEDRKRFLERSLHSVPSRRKSRAFVIQPEITGILFKDRSVLEQLVGKPISDTDYIGGYYEPKKVLAKLLQPSNILKAFEDKLPNVNLASLANDPVLDDLKNFLRHTGRYVQAVS